MTPSRYFAARVAQAFGIVRRNQRMSDAAAETHLLREAEAHLGAAIWEEVKDIEKLSIEYWNLRKLNKEIAELRERLRDLETKLDTAHQERATLLSANPLTDPELAAERADLLNQLEQQARLRDRIVAEARDLRRIYEGLKMKLDVLVREAATHPEAAAEIDQVKTRLGTLREEFAALKEQRLEIGHTIERGDARLNEIDISLDSHRKERRERASITFQTIGELNKELSSLRAEEGLLETRMRQLHTEIGRFVSCNLHGNPQCATAARAHRALTDVMHALRRSIALNHKLAGGS